MESIEIINVPVVDASKNNNNKIDNINIGKKEIVKTNLE